MTIDEFQNYKELQEKLKQVVQIIPTSVSLLGMLDKNKQLIRWAPNIARNLTYAIDSNSFTASINAEFITRIMLYAGGAWASKCGVNFEKVGMDQKPLFIVRYNKEVVQDGLMASAFFPDWPAEKRILYIYRDFDKVGYDPVSILKHELGHVLGFRHEHIRLGRFSRTEPNERLYPITSYDSQSIMHYFLPPYGGSKNGDITILDAEGAAFYYGPPLHLFNEYL